MVAAGRLPGRHAAPPARRCRPGPLRARLLRPPHRPRHPPGGLRAGRPGHRSRARPGPGDRAERDGAGRPVDGRDPAAVRRRTAHARRVRPTAHRLPHRVRRGRPAEGQRAPGPVPRRQPARVRPAVRPRAGPRRDTPRPAADEAAQRQRRPYQPLSAAPRLPRPLRRAGPVGRRGVRPGDARLRAAGLAGQPGGRRRVDPGPAGPHAPDGRARQEPPQRDHVVAGQRVRHRPRPVRHGRLGA